MAESRQQHTFEVSTHGTIWQPVRHELTAEVVVEVNPEHEIER